MKSKDPNLFFFFPLASIGGAERVHLDVLQALDSFQKEIFIRYRFNPWKGEAFKQSKEAKKEGVQLLPEFKRYGKVSFVSKFLEPARFGRIVSFFYIRWLARRINNSANPVVIFWHRESIEFLWPYLKSHVKILDIVHNNSNNLSPDPSYLVNDWVPRLQQRVLVSAGLMDWILPLYASAQFESTFQNRIQIIKHRVKFPLSFPTKTETGLLNVLFNGRDSEAKRFNLVLDIAEHFADNEAIHFTFVGPDPKIYPQRIFPNCTWMGSVSDHGIIDELYQNMHVLLMTSSVEGFPLTIAESMAYGCIPLVTPVGEIKNMLSHEKNALFTDTEKCVEETVLILNSLSTNPEQMRALSKNAYLYAKENFDSNRFNREWQSLIQSLG